LIKDYSIYINYCIKGFYSKGEEWKKKTTDYFLLILERLLKWLKKYTMKEE
jgi:hypothetical protein